MNESLNTLLCSQIKSKKQIEDLEDKFILEKIEKFFLTNGQERKRLEIEFADKREKIIKSKLFKEVLKNIRSEIGVVYGSFLTKDFNKKEKQIRSSYEELLMFHKSSRERNDFYEEVYSKIFDWYKPKLGIVDLACGLNPVSYSLIQNKFNLNLKYFVSDLNPSDMNFLNEFFKINKIDGVAKAYDLTNLKILENENLENFDLVFLFKALDSLEFVKKDVSKELLKRLPQQKIVVSFPTKSLVSKQEFKIEKRNWFFNFLEKEEWSYEQFEIENELFLLIDKNT
jgi:hypothetical protein